MSRTTTLLDLPSDIINLLPIYLHSITDLYALLLTCRALYNAYFSTDIRLPPLLPKLYGQPLLQPHPHLILAGTARQVADWAVFSRSNRAALYSALLEGNVGLLQLSEQVARVSLQDMRHLHHLKYSLLNPLTKIVDVEGGPQKVRNRGNDPDDYPSGIVHHPDTALLNYWIFCELFHHSVDGILNYSSRTPSQPQPLDLKTKRRWTAYCVPDKNNHRNRAWEEIKGFEQLSQAQMWFTCNTFNRRKMALQRFFDSGELQEYSADVKVRIRTYFDNNPAEQHVNLCVDVANHLGVESMKMLLPGGLYQARARLEEIKERVGEIPDADLRKWREKDPLWVDISIAGTCHDGMSTISMEWEEVELADEEANE